jgi:hypothetical protein
MMKNTERLGVVVGCLVTLACTFGIGVEVGTSIVYAADVLVEVTIPEAKVTPYNNFCQTTVLDAVNERRAAKEPPLAPLVSLPPDKCLLAVFAYTYVKHELQQVSVQASVDAKVAAAAARQAVKDANPEQNDP